MDTKVYSIIILFFILLGFFLFIQSGWKQKDDFYDPHIKSKKNIAIITMENRDSLKELVSIHNKSVYDYSQKHGYEYYFKSDYNSEDNLPVYWWKIQYMKDMLDADKWDYILWLDSDVVITRPEIPLEKLIEVEEESNKTGIKSSILIGKDYPGGDNDVFCAGVFMIKNDYMGKKFIYDCLDYYKGNDKCLNTKTGEFTLNGIWAGDCYEQGVMNKLLKGMYSKYMYYIPESFCVNTYKPITTSVILHMFGDKDKALETFKKNV
jgi:hypothetical protein